VLGAATHPCCSRLPAACWWRPCVRRMQGAVAPKL
jgi:hypothetical protein